MKYYEKQVDGITYRVHDYDSIGQFNEYLATAKRNHVFHSVESSEAYGSSFSGTASYKQAAEVFDKGWLAAAERISKKVKVQTSNQQTTRSKSVYNVVGGQASVPRYLQGIPTNMVDRRQVPVKQKIIVINRDITFLASVPASRIEEEGIKALQIIQALENKGYRVKLNMYFLSRQDREAVAYRVCVKKPEERMSILKVAFPLAHPSMLRRITFKWMETHPTMQSKGYAWGYGLPDGAALKKIVDKSEYLLPNFIMGDVDTFVGKMGL